MLPLPQNIWAHTLNSRTQFTVEVFICCFFYIVLISRKTNISFWSLDPNYIWFSHRRKCHNSESGSPPTAPNDVREKWKTRAFLFAARDIKTKSPVCAFFIESNLFRYIPTSAYVCFIKRRATVASFFHAVDYNNKMCRARKCWEKSVFECHDLFALLSDLNASLFSDNLIHQHPATSGQLPATIPRPVVHYFTKCAEFCYSQADIILIGRWPPTCGTYSALPIFE